MDLLRTIHKRVYDALCRLKWEVGQTTAEYALVLLAAAAVAVLLIKWASKEDTLSGFFQAVVTKLTSKANAAP